jgi:hypothetical protein
MLILMDLCARNADWADIADLLKMSAEALQRIAVNLGFVASSGIKAPPAHATDTSHATPDSVRDRFTAADDHHVAACLREGGFIWRELGADGRAETVYPNGERR